VSESGGSGTKVNIARSVARLYRNQLQIVDPETCAVLDRHIVALGETWLIPRQVIHADEDLVSTADAAELAGVEEETIRSWRRRGVIGPDGSTRVHLLVRGLTPDNRPAFYVGEVKAIVRILAARRAGELTRT
jgi:hypothetical protein